MPIKYFHKPKSFRSLCSVEWICWRMCRVPLTNSLYFQIQMNKLPIFLAFKMQTQSERGLKNGENGLKQNEKGLTDAQSENDLNQKIVKSTKSWNKHLGFWWDHIIICHNTYTQYVHTLISCASEQQMRIHCFECARRVCVHTRICACVYALV